MINFRPTPIQFLLNDSVIKYFVSLTYFDFTYVDSQPILII